MLTALQIAQLNAVVNDPDSTGRERVLAQAILDESAQLDSGGDALQVLGSKVVSVGAVTAGDGEVVYECDPGARAVVREYLVIPTADVPNTSPLAFRFNFRPAGAGPGGSTTELFTPAAFVGAATFPPAAMKGGVAYTCPVTFPTGGAYVAEAGGKHSFSVATAHGLAVPVLVVALGFRI